jgi:hypothetical protein
MNTACKRCGHDPACGFAAINDDRYCHDGYCPSTHGVTCYERVSYSLPVAMSHPLPAPSRVPDSEPGDDSSELPGSPAPLPAGPSPPAPAAHLRGG